jgi:GTP-binding protein EngB required for normal cell division
MENNYYNQLKEIENDMVNCFKVYENKLAIIWNKIQKLKKEIKENGN